MTWLHSPPSIPRFVPDRHNEAVVFNVFDNNYTNHADEALDSFCSCCQNVLFSKLQFHWHTSCVNVCIAVRPTLCCQWWHVLMRTPMDLVSICIHSQHQHHDASHDAPRDWTHRGTLDHVQRSHLLICGGRRERKKRKDGQKLFKVQRISGFSRSDKKPTWKSSGSKPNSCCDADPSSTSLLLSHQREMPKNKYSTATNKKLISES